MTTSGLFFVHPTDSACSINLQVASDGKRHTPMPSLSPLLFARQRLGLIAVSFCRPTQNRCLGSDRETAILCVEQSKTLRQNRDGVSRHRAGRPRRSSRITTASDWDFGDRPTIQSDATKTLYRSPAHHLPKIIIIKNKNKIGLFFQAIWFSKKKERPFYLPVNVRFILWSPHRCPVSLLCLEGFIVSSLPLLPEVVIDRFFSCCC